MCCTSYTYVCLRNRDLILTFIIVLFNFFCDKSVNFKDNWGNMGPVIILINITANFNPPLIDQSWIALFSGQMSFFFFHAKKIISLKEKIILKKSLVKSPFC